MNRPRNRQPKSGQAQAVRGRGGHARRGGGIGEPRPAYLTSVPSHQQVVSGARVSIVLKQDQPTGREVEGIVGEVLTRGNHPRGIKVRLQDGRVGRVQRLADSQITRSLPLPETTALHKDDYMASDATDGPPPRTLADFLPDSNEAEAATPSVTQDPPVLSTANAVCPICGVFEGDEIAVSHHVEGHFK